MSYPPNEEVVAGTLSTSAPPNGPNFPNNILQRIIDLAIQGPVVLPPPTHDPRRTLAQVCRRWRNVVTSTSSYWTSFTFEALDGQRPGNILRLAKLLFRRSGNNILLAVRFQRNVARRLFKFVLRSYAHRLWSLSCVVTKKGLKTFFGAGGVHLPLLQHIDLAVVFNTNGHITTRRTPVKGSIDLARIRRAPSLRHVVLHIPNRVHPADFRRLWSRLTHVDLGDTPIRPTTFLKIMGQSLFLEYGVFCINFLRLRDQQSTTFPTTTIPLVRRLRLRLIRPSRDTRIFRKLRMPSLEELWLEREEVGQSIRDMSLYKTLLAKLNAPLKHITFSENFSPTTTWNLPPVDRTQRLIYQQLDRVLRPAHNLTSLYLCPGVFMHPLVLERLASGELLPFLEKLAVSSISGWDILWMVRERNLASTRPESGPSSSNSTSLVAPVARPIALNYLDLFVMTCGLDGGSIQKYKDALEALLLPCGYLFRYIQIPGRASSTS